MTARDDDPQRRPSARARAGRRSTSSSEVTEEPATKKAAAKRPAAKRPATKKAAAKKAAAKRPAAKRPATKKAAAKRPGAKKAPTKPRARASQPAPPPTRATAARGARPSARPPGPDAAILITGICGRLGRLLARRLHRQDRIVGVDRRPFPGCPKDIVHHELDLRRKKTRDLFRSGRIRAVVHLGVLHDPRASDKEHHSWNVVAFQKLLDYLAQYNVPKLVVLSSANVYGPQPDNPQFLTEDAPLLGAQAFRGIRDLIELDMLAQGFFWKRPETETVILRPCHILGRVHNAPSNYLRLESPMTLMGFDPMVQVIHERDVVDAIARALEPGIRGVFNVKGPGELPLSRILRMLGRRPKPVPSMMAKAALDRLWRYRLTSFPPPELDHIRYVCMVDDSRARAVLGYEPRFGIDDTVQSVARLR